MNASPPNLHLLRNTPFFAALTPQQLSWVIKMSCEWEADPSTPVGESAPQDELWILLDGAWQLEIDGQHFAAGRADPGNWFSARGVVGPWRLVTTEASHLMQIARADFEAMLAQGFNFREPMEAGQHYYGAIFGDGVSRQPLAIC
jgi:hypothetical protein